MATITLEYDAKNAFATSMIASLKKSGAFKAVSTTRSRNPQLHAGQHLCAVELSQKEAREGKVNHYRNSRELFAKFGVEDV